PPQRAPNPDTSPQAERAPDQRRLEPMPAAEPQTRTDVEQPRAKGQPLGRVAIAPLLPPLLPAREHNAGGPVLPGIAHDDAGQREHRPAEAVNDQHGFEIFARPRFEPSVECERVSVARARQEEGAQRAAIVVSMRYPRAKERPTAVNEQNQ